MSANSLHGRCLSLIPYDFLLSSCYKALYHFIPFTVLKGSQRAVMSQVELHFGSIATTHTSTGEIFSHIQKGGTAGSYKHFEKKL